MRVDEFRIGSRGEPRLASKERTRTWGTLRRERFPLISETQRRGEKLLIAKDGKEREEREENLTTQSAQRNSAEIAEKVL